jgi:glutamine amidotransferase
MIAIVDTGGANLASIINALLRLGHKSQVTLSAEDVRGASHVILPGVGAAPKAGERLSTNDLAQTLRQLKTPVLGICLGMQMLFDRSQEGDTQGLGIIPGRVDLLKPQGLSVPHMGWNAVSRTSQKKSPLLNGIDDGAYFYFVHSYAAPMGPWVEATCDYPTPIPAVVRHNNFMGVQFHPERSGTIGARVLENFLSI